MGGVIGLRKSNVVSERPTELCLREGAKRESIAPLVRDGRIADDLVRGHRVVVPYRRLQCGAPGKIAGSQQVVSKRPRQETVSMRYSWCQVRPSQVPQEPPRPIGRRGKVWL